MKRLLGALHVFVKSRYFYPAVLVGCLVPALLLGLEVYQAFGQGNIDALGVNPIQALEHETGEDALLILLCSLAVTPVRRLTGWNAVQKVRRMVGVTSFFYALGHVAIYLVFDRNCYSWAACQGGVIWADLVKRPFIFVGMLAFVVLLALAVTSTKGWIRRLGRRWQTVHRAVYVGAIAAVVHFIWGQKVHFPDWTVIHSAGDAVNFVVQLAYIEPLKWAAFCALLLGIRVWFAARKRMLAAAGVRATPRPVQD